MSWHEFCQEGVPTFILVSLLLHGMAYDLVEVLDYVLIVEFKYDGMT